MSEVRGGRCPVIEVASGLQRFEVNWRSTTFPILLLFFHLVDKTAALAIGTCTDGMKSFTNFGFVLWVAHDGSELSFSMGKLTF